MCYKTLEKKVGELESSVALLKNRVENYTMYVAEMVKKQNQLEEKFDKSDKVGFVLLGISVAVWIAIISFRVMT